MLNYRLPIKSDVEFFSKNLCISDKNELKELGITNIKNAIYDSLFMSDECHVAYSDNGIICLFGVCGGLGYGKPFLLSTSLIKNYKKELIIIGKKLINIWLNQYHFLWNITSKKNNYATNVIKKLGFDFVYHYENSNILEFHLEKGNL